MVQVTPSAPSGFGMKPESKPPSIFLQGSSNVLWVTVWFFCMKWNSTVSPGAAWMFSGVYCSMGVGSPVGSVGGLTPPTMTVWVAARALLAAKSGRNVVAFIMLVS